MLATAAATFWVGSSIRINLTFLNLFYCKKNYNNDNKNRLFPFFSSQSHTKNHSRGRQNIFKNVITSNSFVSTSRPSDSDASSDHFKSKFEKMDFVVIHHLDGGRPFYFGLCCFGLFYFGLFYSDFAGRQSVPNFQSGEEWLIL